MSKITPRVYIVEPYADSALKHVQQIRMLFHTWGWEVKKISPDDKTYYENSVLVVPDTGGLNACVSYCFTGGSLTPPHVAPQDQAIEWFRLKTLHYYVGKGIPILGLGHSSSLIFAEVVGGGLIFGSDGFSREAPNHKLPHVEDDEGFICTKPKMVCGGLDKTQPHAFGEELIVLADQLLKYHGKGGGHPASVKEPINPSLGSSGGKITL
jgi:hypothetical protein